MFVPCALSFLETSSIHLPTAAFLPQRGSLLVSLCCHLLPPFFVSAQQHLQYLGSWHQHLQKTGREEASHPSQDATYSLSIKSFKGQNLGLVDKHRPLVV